MLKLPNLKVLTHIYQTYLYELLTTLTTYLQPLPSWSNCYPDANDELRTQIPYTSTYMPLICCVPFNYKMNIIREADTAMWASDAVIPQCKLLSSNIGTPYVLYYILYIIYQNYHIINRYHRWNLIKIFNYSLIRVATLFTTLILTLIINR